MDDRRALFETWAAYYDESLKDTKGFPFEGYPQVLARLATLPKAAPLRVLDLGTGTGALAAGYASLGHWVSAADFSEAMLEKARVRVPSASFAQVDLLYTWPDLMRSQTFDVIASAYVFHEFSDVIKSELVARLVEETLAPGGVVLIGDIAFTNRAVFNDAQVAWRQQWDDDEFYWVADEALEALNDRGFKAAFEPVSFCAGIFIVPT